MNLRSISLKARNHYNLSLIDYMIQYENFIIPKCKFCDKNSKKRCGITFYQTCGSLCCKNTKHSNETKLKLRNSRLKYMKENPDKTAWRSSNMSYPEKKFLEHLIKNKFDKKFLIIREYSEYPYFIDFAFVDFKVGVEIDGSQHINIEYDKNRDLYLLSKGWRIIRITAKAINENINSAIDSVLSFINSDNKSEMIGILLHKDYRRNINVINKIEKEKIKLNLIQNRIELILNSGIDFSICDWTNKLSTILNITPYSVNRWVKKNMTEFYKNCYHRK